MKGHNTAQELGSIFKFLGLNIWVLTLKWPKLERHLHIQWLPSSEVLTIKKKHTHIFHLAGSWGSTQALHETAWLTSKTHKVKWIGFGNQIPEFPFNKVLAISLSTNSLITQCRCLYFHCFASFGSSAA